MAKRTAKTSGWVAQKAGDISVRVAESIVRRVGPKQGFGAQLQVSWTSHSSDQALPGCVLQQSIRLSIGLAGVASAAACSIRGAFCKLPRSALQAPDPVQTPTEGFC